MKKGLMFLVLLLVLSSVFAVVQDNYLVTIDLSLLEKPKVLEAMEINIYYKTDQTLISGLSDFKVLHKNGISFTVIDEEPWSEKYYLLYDLKGERTEPVSDWGRVIYRNSRTLLIKSPALTVDQINSIPHKITELFPLPLKLSFDTIYPSPQAELPVRRTEIDQLLTEINPDSLGYFIQSLEDFVTRYCFAPNRDEVAGWIESEFLRFGYTDVVIDSFFQQGVWHKNVVATLPGTVNPEQVVIIGGHHDSITQSGNPMLLAPGADDNGSGAGAALEVARAMKAINFQPETTIKFITFAAEEVGLWGSHHNAATSLDEGMNIKLLINNDMIAYTIDPPANWRIHLTEYSGFENQSNFARQIVQQYTNITPVTYPAFLDAPFSDSYSYWIRGFPPIFFIEPEVFDNPYYHQPDDLLIHLNLDYAVETVRASAAIAVLVNEIPDIPEDLTVIDAGNGTELIAEWSPVSSPNFDFYEIHLGLSSGNYDTSFTTGDVSCTLSGLEEGITYYIGISAVSTSGYSSSITESSGVPGTVPLTPVDFRDLPKGNRIDLTWTHNTEADLAGYNLYRSETEGELGVQINPYLIEANYFVDIDVETGEFYYYSLTALDDSANESVPSEQVRSRIVSLDQGVLIVAGTSDGNGSFQNPALTETTQFYNDLLADYSPDTYPLWSEDRIKLADLGAYSTLIWHRNNVSAHQYGQETINAIIQYLDAGGNILFTTYFPSRLLGRTDFYPQNYAEGDFLYDYLKIDEIVLHQSSRFVAAQTLLTGYPELTIDEDKAPSGLNHHIINIESVHSTNPGTDIYAYHSGYPSGSNEASMQGLPVGIEYLGDDYKVILLSFPLYYIDQVDAAALISFIMNEKFDEQVGIGEEDILPVSGKPYRLYANHPNPFNPETVIRYSLEQESEITLEVYNLKGQKVRLLTAEKRLPGEYSVVWNGKDDSGKEAASGIYFYRLTTDYGKDIRKMLLLK
jgi:hypothetical protein